MTGMHERILGIDYGRKRHGLAVSDGLGMSSLPLPALFRSKDPAADLAHFREVVEDRDIRRIVLGLPLHMNGDEGEMAREVRAFGEKLGDELGLPVEYSDERLTSEEADDILAEAGVKRSERKGLRDSIAAALIVREVLEADRLRERHPEG